MKFSVTFVFVSLFTSFVANEFDCHQHVPNVKHTQIRVTNKVGGNGSGIYGFLIYKLILSNSTVIRIHLFLLILLLLLLLLLFCGGFESIDNGL